MAFRVKIKFDIQIFEWLSWISISIHYLLYNPNTKVEKKTDMLGFNLIAAVNDLWLHKNICKTVLVSLIRTKENQNIGILAIQEINIKKENVWKFGIQKNLKGLISQQII